MAETTNGGDEALGSPAARPEDTAATEAPAPPPAGATAPVEDHHPTAAQPGKDRRRSEQPEPSATAGGQAPQPKVPAQCLTFTLAGDEYGVGILQIREIVEYDTLTKVPGTPPWILGVMNLRGTVVPVVDLAIKFGLPEIEVTARTCIVMVEADLDGEPTLMGVMAEAVVRVLDLAPEDVEAPPAFGTRVRVEFLLGVGKVDGDLVLVLDIDRVLSLDELLAVAAVPAAAEEEDLPARDSAADPPAEMAAAESGEAQATSVSDPPVVDEPDTRA